MTEKRHPSRLHVPHGRLHPLLLFLGFFIVAVVVYLPALQSFFHSDDFWLLEAVKRDGPFGVWSNRDSAFLRPLISLSLYLDWRLWGLYPLSYHAANVFVHTINALIVAALFPLLIRVFKHGANPSEVRRGAIFSGLLFLVQPLHPEAVTWISGRTDVYAAFFCLLAFFIYLRSREKGNRLWQVGALFYGLSLLCKEASILFPLVIVTLEFFRTRDANDAGSTERPQKRAATASGYALPFFAVVAAYLLLRVYILGKLIGGYGAAHTTFRIGQLVQSALWFFCSAFLPMLPRWSYCFALLTLLVIVIFVRLRQQVKPHPTLGFLMAAFCLSCAPVLNLGGGPAPDGMSGRLVYLASAFAALALVSFVDFLLPNRRVASVALTTIAGIFGVQLYLLNLTWLHAGRVAQRCIADIGLSNQSLVISPHRIVVLTVPDTLYPAYILRNGLPEAMRLFHPDSASQIDIVSSVILHRVQDRVTIFSRRPEGMQGQRTLDLVAANSPARLVQPCFTLYIEKGLTYQAAVISDTRLQVTLLKTADPQAIFFVYHQGHFEQLDSTPVTEER